MPDDRLLETLLFGMVEGERRPGARGFSQPLASR